MRMQKISYKGGDRKLKVIIVEGWPAGVLRVRALRRLDEKAEI